ncbi:glycosyltransferase family 2 protein [Slackia heliotrinireducens]|uniref:glycosyltransferase family 2 protein n=1 Tax=Slackia heliotrinireducens TaxID=84110 RepID=UPI003315EBA6
MNPVLLIPTYVSARSRMQARGVTTTYDHMTALSAPGELPRCLDSLRKVRGLGEIIILVVAEPAVENQAAEKIRKLAAEYDDLNISVIGAPEMDVINQRMAQLGINVNKEIGLQGYGAVRNLGLLLANALGFDAAVFVDDDEIVDDEDFLERAMYGLGKLTRRGVPILAKTGYYLNAQESFLSQSQDRWYNHFWEQGKTFNQWIMKAMKGPRLSRSNHVCGGCLALHKEAFKRVAFDPWIARGEDLDYMLNLRMYGSDIWFDNKWVLHHLPPATKSEGMRFRQDIFRWLYEFRKVEYARTQIDLMQIKPQSLEPYPGPFLEPGLQKRVKRTALLRSIGRSDGKGYRKAAHSASTDAAKYATDNCAKYFKFQYTWPTIMARLEDDAILKSVLGQSANQGQARFEEQVAKGWSGGVDPGMTSEIRLNIGSEE